MFTLSEEIKNFLESSGPIFFVTPNPNRAIGLEKIIPNFHIICSQKSDILEQFKKEDIKFFLLDDAKINTAGRILRNDSVINYIKNNSIDFKANILTFKPSPMIEKVCLKNNFKYLGSDWRLNRKWEDKIIFAETLKNLDLKNPNNKIYILNEEHLEKNFLDFSNNEKYIAQFARGYSGKSSFLLNSEKDFLNIVKDNLGKKVKISDYIIGETFTINICIGDFGVVKSSPIFQITGFSDLNKNILGTCGNDYAYAEKTISEETRKKISNSIDKLSLEIKNDGYRGIFGMDFIVSNEDIYIIEVNPRMIGSIPIFTKLEIEQERVPILLLHILTFLDFDFDNFNIKHKTDNISFSQVIFRNNKKVNQKIIEIPETGIYSIKNDELCFEEKTYFANQNNLSDGKILIQSLSRGSVVSPDNEYLNVQFGCGIMKNSGAFVDYFNKVSEIIFSKVVLES